MAVASAAKSPMFMPFMLPTKRVAAMAMALTNSIKGVSRLCHLTALMEAWM